MLKKLLVRELNFVSITKSIKPLQDVRTFISKTLLILYVTYKKITVTTYLD